MSSEIVQNEEVRDRLGQIIGIGSIIAYGHALGRCAGLQLGKVLAVKTIVIPAHYTTWEWAKVTYPEPTRRVELAEPKMTAPARREYRITVWGVDEDWGGKYKPFLTSRKGTLQYPDRMIVISTDKVPMDVAELVKDVTIYSTPKSLGIAGQSYLERRVLRE